MKFRVKDMDIATGGPQVVTLNNEDAEFLNIYHGDRINIKYRSRFTTSIVNIAQSEKAIKKNHIGMYEEVLRKLKIKNNYIVDISLDKKPDSVQYIKKKLNGFTLSDFEINEIVRDITENKLSDIEVTYFVSACHTNIMSMKETISLTKAMVTFGDVLRLKKYPVIDKHCVGGVPGNRTTPIVVSILAAAGLTVPKTSSRSITSPAGTADTMEVMTNVTLPIEKIKKVLAKTGACLVWGGSMNLAPADDRIIRVEHPLSIDSRSQLLASIMAKKASVSATHVLVDIPIGKGAKIENKKQALMLKRQFEQIGNHVGMKVKVIITNGSQPIGNGLGPALEARDILWLLKNDPKAPQDLKTRSVNMAGLILEMAGKSKKGNGRKKALDILNSGEAYKKFIDMVTEQGKKKINPEKIKPGNFSYEVKAGRSGKVKSMDNNNISKIARVAGAPNDKYAGIYLNKHVGDAVKKNEVLFTVYSNNKQRLNFSKEVKNSFIIK
ncbi:AMP phosphorylase [Candidatus Woesearchaeota archaeon]|nr:AMP phosphorylase [Candidatus Woesearchaeota archaeon]